MTCASSGNVEAVRPLVARGAGVDAQEPSQNQDALMWAASERQASVVRLLIEAGANPQAHTKKGFTALHFAAREGDIDSVRALLASGVSVDIRSRPEAAAETGRDANAGPSPARSASGTAVAPRGPGYQATISEGSTPLLVATVRGHVPPVVADTAPAFTAVSRRTATAADR